MGERKGKLSPPAKQRYNTRVRQGGRAVAESEIIFAVEEVPEGGYAARALGFSIHTQANTLEELKTWCRMLSGATSRLTPNLG